MRSMAIALPLLALAACNVSKDDQNGAVTIQYDQNTAENAAADVGNFTENVAADISNDVGNTADKIKNSDVDVKVNKDVKTDNAAENKQ